MRSLVNELIEFRAMREAEFASRSQEVAARLDRQQRTRLVSRVLSALRVGQRVTLPGRLRLHSRLGGWQ